MESKSSTMSRLNSSDFLAMRVDLLGIKKRQKIGLYWMKKLPSLASSWIKQNNLKKDYCKGCLCR